MKELQCDQEKNCLVGTGLQKSVESSDVKMLFYNKLPGYLSLRVRYIDNQSVYFYTLDGKIVLPELLHQRRLNAELIRTIFYNLMDAIHISREYLLNPIHLVLEPEYIYWDVQEERLALCYFPEYQSSMSEKVERLCQYLLQHVNHGNRSDAALMYGIYDMIAGSGFDEYAVKKYLKDFKNQTEEGEDPGRDQQRWEGAEDQKGEMQDWEGAEDRKRERQDWEGLENWKRELQDWEGAEDRKRERQHWEDAENAANRERRYRKERKGDDTEGKKAKQKRQRKKGAILMGLRNISGERGIPSWVTILERGIEIGRGIENEMVLPFIEISRQHARIEYEEDGLILTDLDSVNGVWLNGRRLFAHHPVPCFCGDEISFADISYRIERQEM